MHYSKGEIWEGAWMLRQWFHRFCQFFLTCREKIWGNPVGKVHEQRAEAGTGGRRKAETNLEQTAMAELSYKKFWRQNRCTCVSDLRMEEAPKADVKGRWQRGLSQSHSEPLWRDGFTSREAKRWHCRITRQEDQD